MHRIALFLSLLLLAPLADLAAQESPPLTPGARVRVSNRWRGSEVGTLIALKSDTLVLNVKGQTTPLAVPFASVSKLEVSKGQKRSARKGAGRGFLIGACCGILVGAGAGTGSSESEGMFLAIPVLGGGGGIIGALIGTFIGAEADHWEPAPLPVRVGVAPQRGGGIRLAASFAF